MKIDKTKKYVTRDGLAVEVLRTDLTSAMFPVAVIVTGTDGNQTILGLTSEGKYWDKGLGEHPYDLQEAPPPSKWKNVYTIANAAGWHDSRKKADAACGGVPRDAVLEKKGPGNIVVHYDV